MSRDSHDLEATSRITPGTKAFDVDAEVHATNDLTTAFPKCIYCGSDGTVVAVKVRDETADAVTYNVLQGQYLLGPFRQVLATSTATGLVGEYD